MNTDAKKKKKNTTKCWEIKSSKTLRGSENTIIDDLSQQHRMAQYPQISCCDIPHDHLNRC